MRLNRSQLLDITGYKRQSSQAEWFSRHLGVTVPCDEKGPIITESAYQALVDKKLGLGPEGNNGKAKPRIQPVRS